MPIKFGKYKLVKNERGKKPPMILVDYFKVIK